MHTIGSSSTTRIWRRSSVPVEASRFGDSIIEPWGTPCSFAVGLERNGCKRPWWIEESRRDGDEIRDPPPPKFKAVSKSCRRSSHRRGDAVRPASDGSADATLPAHEGPLPLCPACPCRRRAHSWTNQRAVLISAANAAGCLPSNGYMDEPTTFTIVFVRRATERRTGRADCPSNPD